MGQTVTTRSTVNLFLGADASGSPETISAGGTQVDNIGPVIPSGQRIRIARFGGSDAGSDGAPSLVALQWGAAGTWETLRVFAMRGAAFSERIMRDLVGDGTKRLRIIRKNQSTTEAKSIFAWIEGYQI